MTVLAGAFDGLLNVLDSLYLRLHSAASPALNSICSTKEQLDTVSGRKDNTTQPAHTQEISPTRRKLYYQN